MSDIPTCFSGGWADSFSSHVVVFAFSDRLLITVNRTCNVFHMWLSFRCAHLHPHDNMRFNIFHRCKSGIIKRKEMWEKSVLWGLRRCLQSLQRVGHFRATWQLILFYFLRCIFSMLIPFHPRREHKYKTQVLRSETGSESICSTEPKASHTSLGFLIFPQKLLSE